MLRVWRMRPSLRETGWAAESSFGFQNQVTLPFSSRRHLISTVEPRFLATNRGCCQIQEQVFPVGVRAGIKILLLAFWTTSLTMALPTPQPWPLSWAALTPGLVSWLILASQSVAQS